MKEAGSVAFDADRIAALFTRDGHFLCARWRRPVAPVIFGLADESLAIFRQVTRAAISHAGHQMVETDAEMGANMFTIFAQGWDDLANVPDLDQLTGQPDLIARLHGSGAEQYRIFRFDQDGSIRACLNFINVAGGTSKAHPAQLAEALIMRSLLTFATEVAPCAALAALIRAAYDPVLPDAATDPSHALRLAARLAS